MGRKIFMGGICGMGMAPLAMFLRDEGCEVSGFDDNPNPAVKSMLLQKGVKFCESKKPDFDTDEFIITSALKYVEQNLKDAPCKKFLRRGVALAEIANKRRLIGVCGSHGKTTTTSLISHAISTLNLDAGYITGAIPNGIPPQKFCEKNKILAAELDESDGTIENFSPEITVALNGDLDHTDTYPDLKSLEEMFARLFSRTKKYIVIPEGDGLLKRAADSAKAETIFVKCPKDDFMMSDKLMALCALNLAFERDFSLSVFDEFKGVGRRQEILKDDGEILAVADYAHHPSEIAAFFSWLDKNSPQNKLVFFQPHRYSRTKRFAKDFQKILQSRADKGDKIYILPVYPASEPFEEGGSEKNIANSNLMLANFQDIGHILNEFKRNAESKFCAAFIGAGDIYFYAKKLF